MPRVNTCLFPQWPRSFSPHSSIQCLSTAPFSQDLEARATHLEECKANLDDPGPLHDCVVWRGEGGVEGGGEGWWAAIDTKEDGDLTEAVAMTDFDKVCVMCVHARAFSCVLLSSWWR